MASRPRARLQLEGSCKIAMKERCTTKCFHVNLKNEPSKVGTNINKQRVAMRSNYKQETVFSVII